MTSSTHAQVVPTLTQIASLAPLSATLALLGTSVLQALTRLTSVQQATTVLKAQTTTSTTPALAAKSLRREGLLRPLTVEPASKASSANNTKQRKELCAPLEPMVQLQDSSLLTIQSTQLTQHAPHVLQQATVLSQGRSNRRLALKAPTAQQVLTSAFRVSPASTASHLGQV